MADTSRARPRAHRNDIEAARERRRERLARSVELLRSSEGFRGWLRAMKRLHRYSPQNVRLIVSQCPQATFVASYRRWQRELGYQVRRGERGIMVFVPRLVRVDAARESTEGRDDPDGKRVIFRAGYVFDRSQVEPIPGRALPLEAPEPAPIDGDTHAHLIARCERFAAELGFDVERAPIEGGALGCCDRARRRIAVAVGLSRGARARPRARPRHGRRLPNPRARACGVHRRVRRLPHPGGTGSRRRGPSVPYLAGWAAENGEVLERDAAEIDRIARRLEEALDRGEVAAEAA